MDRSQDDADVRGRGSRARRIVRGGACVFFVFHLAAITLANVPRTTALGTGFHTPFAQYTWYAGLWQTWDMFTTIPHWADIDVLLTARNFEGREVLYGPMLPRLEPYRKNLRLHGFFVRITMSRARYPAFSHRYFAGACDAVERKTGVRPASVGLELRTKKLRRIDDIAADGEIAESKTYRFEEASCQ